MKIKQNTVVEVAYQVEADGQVVDQMTAERPLDYIQGGHMLIPAFEAALEGLQAGEEFAFTVSPEQGYGPHDDKLLTDIPLKAFEVDGKLREDLLVVGYRIPLLDEYGQVQQATIVEIGPERVTMDFNHPMAGKTLSFRGTVVSVREATEKELKEGLHGEFLPPEERHHCCHGKGRCHRHGEIGEGHCHHHEDGEGCCHNHEDGEGCCHNHEDGEGCCHNHEG